MAELADELRFARPRAPEALRGRVLEIAAREPAPRAVRTWPRIRVRRAVLMLAPAAVAIGVGAAVVHGVVAGGRPQPQAAQRGEPQALNAGKSIPHGSA